MQVPAVRFWSKVAQTGNVCECWDWTAGLNKGYGRFRIGTRTRQAHEVAYEMSIGPVADGLELDHLCRNRICVNPWHLEPVTHAINCRRAEFKSLARHHTAKTHCPSGHPYDAENTITKPTNTGVHRYCRACRKIANRKYSELKRQPEMQ